MCRRLACSGIQHSGETRCDRVKTLEVPKSRVNLDHSSKETHVGRLACLGIRHSGETRCDRVKTPEVPKSKVHPEPFIKGDVCQKINLFRVRRSGELECASVKSSEARSPEVTWPADVTRDDVDTWDVCHVSVS
jgi:hypothetical protein